MNREIKLKAWINEYKKFWDVITINFSTKEILAPDGEWYKYDELVEFTGLKDSKGVEIYEGDIVRVLGRNGHGVYNTEVKFENGCFRPIGVDDCRCHLSDVDRDFKVIGNIYQSKELLK